VSSALQELVKVFLVEPEPTAIAQLHSWDEPFSGPVAQCFDMDPEVASRLFTG
jgi:hypothetical protein